MPEVLVEEYPITGAAQCAVLYSGVRLVNAPGVYWPRIKIDDSETGNTSIFRNAVLVGGPDLTFSGDTITRSANSWILEGWRAGETIKIRGSTSNDGEYVISEVTSATVLTCAGASFTSEGPTTPTGWVVTTLLKDCHIY